MSDQSDAIKDLSEIGELSDRLFPGGAQTDEADGEANTADSTSPSSDEVNPAELAPTDESIVGEPAIEADDTSEAAETELDELRQMLLPLLTEARAAFALAPPTDAGDWTPEERVAFHRSRAIQQALADAIFAAGYLAPRPDGWEDDRITQELTKDSQGNPPSVPLAEMLEWSREYRHMWYVRVTYHLVMGANTARIALRDFRYPWQPKPRARQAVPTPPTPTPSDDPSFSYGETIAQHPLWSTLSPGQQAVAREVVSIKDKLAANPSLDYAWHSSPLRQLLLSEAQHRGLNTHKVQSAVTYLKGVIRRDDDIVKAVAELHLWQQPAAPPRDVPAPPTPTPVGSLPIDVPMDDWPFEDVIIISGDGSTEELLGSEADRIAAETAFLLEEGTLSMSEILARVTAQP